jgi:ribosomal protein S18 acetylase RimI-like enzyme
MSTMSPDEIVEEFGEQWSRSDLTTKMPLPGVVANGRLVELTSIGVHGPHQGMGYASRALRMLTGLCDANGVTIELIARPLEPSLRITANCPATRSIDELIAWYRRHGFVDAWAAGDDTRRMIRKPLTPSFLAT